MELTQEYLDKHFHGRFVWIKPQDRHNHFGGLPDKEYIVTGCQLKDNHLELGLLATDFTPENKQWHYIPLCLECAKRLDEILTISKPDHHYESIIYEAFCVVTEVNGDEIKVGMGMSTKTEIEFPKMSPHAETKVGDLLYLIVWKALWGPVFERRIQFNDFDYTKEENYNAFIEHGTKVVQWWARWGYITDPHPPGCSGGETVILSN